MRSSTFGTALLALGVSARFLGERDYVTETSVVVQTVFVTEDVYATAAPAPIKKPAHHPAPKVTVVTEAASQAPAPAPSSSAAPAAAPAPAAPAAPASGAAPSVDATVDGNYPAYKNPGLNWYQNMVVDHHNVHRMNHTNVLIQWDDDLAAWAQQLAEVCVFAHANNAGSGNYGQNIAAGVPPSGIGGIITDMFYNGEINQFGDQYGEANPNMANFENFGHFSQVVWAGTTSVGCATVDCSSHGGVGNAPGTAPYMTFCNYYPPGNFGGEWAQNVLPPKGRPSVDGSWAESSV